MTTSVRLAMVTLATIVVCWCPRVSRCADDEIRPAADRPQPKSPGDSAKCVRLPAGFSLENVAAEPLIREPAGICFDEHGRLFVGEIHGYNLDGYLDIIELNKTGRLDREVRRVRHATPANQIAAKLETYGAVRALTDTDGDGHMDKSDVWADRLPPCYGVIAARGGVIAICAPDIVFLADRDGDGRAEVRETLFTGFSRELIERGMSSPRWGLDNWIYVAAGGGGGEITGPKLPQPVSIGNTDFRFKADGARIEPVTGTESMFGLTMTDFGDRFHTIITQVAPLDHRYLVRNPFMPSPPGDVAINGYREIFPISQPDPWRLVRGSDPAWVKFYGPMETKPNGFFTATSGQLIYRADALPAEFHGNYFVCDPANNLIHRALLERDGLGYTARRAPGEEQSEFLASTDQWFRPMSLSIGPDGSIYIVDMYREIIEDFSAIPRFLQQQYAESLIAGKDHGRIWRLRGPPADERQSPRKELGPGGAPRVPSSTADLVALLAHPNPWWRELAQRLLVDRRDRSSLDALARLARGGPTPQSRVHALYTLDGLGMLDADDARTALGDAHYGVRLHGLRLAERWFDRDESVLTAALTLVDDEEPRVRLQAALSLGETTDPRALDRLARFAIEHGDERWSAAAIISSVANSADALLEKVLAEKPVSPGAMALLEPLAETVASRRESRPIGRVLRLAAECSSDPSGETQLAILDGLARGLARSKRSPLRDDDAPRSIERLLMSPSAEVRQRTLQLVDPLKLAESAAMQRAWDSAGTVAVDGEQPLAMRLVAVSILSTAPWQRLEPLRGLLDARQPIELQLAVVAALTRLDDPRVAECLLGNWLGLAPKVQEAITDGLFARQDRLPSLLDAIEKGTVPANSLNSLRREQLVEHGIEAIRSRARGLLSGRGNDDRAAVIRSFESALALPGEPRPGAVVFEKTCARCHKLGDKGIGFEVGPDLAAARLRADATLLIDILDPSGAITNGFTVYTVVTNDGRVHTGLLASESATSITLRNAAEPDQARAAGTSTVIETTVLRKDIESMNASSKSLMPDGLEKELEPRDIANLIAFLRESLGHVLATGIVLFDDEQAYVDALADGGAVASLSSDDRHSGTLAMRLTNGQRSTPRVPGWRYRIVEQPAATKPGEPEQFRYLRFAWKSAGATGLMYEFADDGRWPPAEKPIRRYYSGKNSMPWKATEVSSIVPKDWTTVTVDLWKDFGEFTLTGIGPVAMEGDGLFDRIELLRTLEGNASIERTTR